MVFMEKVSVTGSKVLDKTVKDRKDCGYIYLPKGWVGHSVKVVLDGE